MSVRRTDGQGSETDAVVARAEKALKTDDLAGAVKEVGTLAGAPADAAAAWLGAARQRLTVEQALSNLAATSAAALAPGNG